MSVPVYRKRLAPDEEEWNRHFDRLPPEDKARIESMGGGRFVLATRKPRTIKQGKRVVSKETLTEEQRFRVCGKRHSVRALFGKIRSKFKRRKRRK